MCACADLERTQRIARELEERMHAAEVERRELEEASRRAEEARRQAEQAAYMEKEERERKVGCPSINESLFIILHTIHHLFFYLLVDVA